MTILGGIFGSLVDYDNGGTQSRAQQDLEIRQHRERVGAFLDNQNKARSARERIAQLEQELAQTKRTLAAREANIAAIMAQRDMFQFELEATCPKSPLFQDTGKVDEKGQPITFARMIWRDAYTREIKARFGADADPATFHTAFRKK